MKVFNVLVNEVYNFETSNSIYSFLNKEDAEAKVKQLRDNYMQQVEPDDGYEITDEPALFDCYPEGEYGEQHYTVQIYECEVEGSDSTTVRSLAMRQMEQELIEVVKEYGEDGYLDVDDIGMAWTEECDGECYTKEIFALAVGKSWDEDEQLVVHMHGGDELFMYCDREDLGHNLADYIYNEMKSYY